MPLILNNDGTIFADVPSIAQVENEFKDMLLKMHAGLISTCRGEAISTLSFDDFLEICYGNFQNRRGKESDTCIFVPEETEAGGSDTGINGRPVKDKSTKALPMGTVMGAGGRVEEKTS